jgi:hypothetical protein
MWESNRYYWVVLCKIVCFTFGRVLVLITGREFRLAKQTPSRRARLSIAASMSDAMNAAENICITPQKS